MLPRAQRWVRTVRTVTSLFSIQVAFHSERERLESALEQARAVTGDDDYRVPFATTESLRFFDCVLAGELEDRLRLSNSDLEGDLPDQGTSAIAVTCL